MPHTSCLVRGQLIFGIAMLFSIGLPTVVQAAAPAERLQAAQGLVKEALHREIYGLSGERDQLLEEAREKMPNYEPAHWHAGFVKRQGKWVRYDEMPAITADDTRYQQYRLVRERHKENVADQLALAHWCNGKNLPEQARAHLTRVVQLDPDNAEARRLLGFRFVAGEWISSTEVEAARQERKEAREALRVWQPRIVEIRADLARNGLAHQQAAAQRLLEIEDPQAVQAIELVLANSNEKTAQLVVQAFDRMTTQQASAALGRLAVFSPWESVRNAAGDALADRPQEEFAPQLLAGLFTRSETRRDLFQDRSGRLAYRHVVVREGQEKHELAVVDTLYERAALPGGDGRNTLLKAVDDAVEVAISRELTVQEQNARTAAVNDRIMKALGRATGDKQKASPEEWWSWWNEENEVFVQTDKPVKTLYETEVVTIEDDVPLYIETGGGSSGPPQSSDCLAAGTLVWTDAGMKRIEMIEVGDRVLSQDPDTGELAYKPVLQTTIRPASQLVRIQAGEHSVTTSGGHLFWVAGEGWQRSRKLSSGTELHRVNGTLRVSEVAPGPFEPTYNLIVADFHSYFVGEGMLLSHDNTIRRATNSVVPGLTER